MNLNPRLQILQRTLKRLMRRGAKGPLEKLIDKAHAADLGHLLVHFSVEERRQIIALCHDEHKRAHIIAAAPAELAASLIEPIPRDKASGILQHIEPDDVSDILEHLPQDVATDLLERMHGEERTQVEDLSQYDSATAGGIMSPRFFALPPQTTVRDAIAKLQEVSGELEMVFYIYVTNEADQLLGVVSLRQLVTHRADKTLEELMITDVVTVRSEEDQEEVARLASRYGLLALPVIDDSRKLLGIITVDDVIDVLREEATEDILRMAGAGPVTPQTQDSVLRSTFRRLPWILGQCVGGVLIAFLLTKFAPQLLADHLYLTFYLPVVLGLSGVVGTQTAAIVSQSIAQGGFGRVLFSAILRQMTSGSLLALICGAFVGIVERIIGTPGPTAISVGVGTAASMIGGGLVTGAMPILFSQLRIDPAVAAGPLATIIADVMGVIIFLFSTVQMLTLTH